MGGYLMGDDPSITPYQNPSQQEMWQGTQDFRTNLFNGGQAYNLPFEDPNFTGYPVGSYTPNSYTANRATSQGYNPNTATSQGYNPNTATSQGYTADTSDYRGYTPNTYNPTPYTFSPTIALCLRFLTSCIRCASFSLSDTTPIALFISLL